MGFLKDPRFAGLKPFEKKVWLATPTMHGEEKKWVDEAIDTNWVSTVGENINQVEKQIAGYVGVKYAVGLSAGPFRSISRQDWPESVFTARQDRIMAPSKGIRCFAAI